MRAGIDRYHFFAERTFHLKVDTVCSLVFVLHVGCSLHLQMQVKDIKIKGKLSFLLMCFELSSLSVRTIKDFNSLLRMAKINYLTLFFFSCLRVRIPTPPPQPRVTG